MTAFFKRYAKTLLVIAGVILFYEIFTDIGGILNSVVFPGLSEVLPAFGKALPELFYGLWCSLQKLVPAFVLALVIGIGVGLPVGQSEELRKMLGPIFNGLASVPATLLTTYAITVFPTFQGASIFIIFLGCLWPILNGTISGVTLIEKSYINSARILELKGFTLTAKVILPGAMPSILDGVKLALVTSFLLLIVAEMFGADAGLGYFVQYYSDFSQFDLVISGILFMAIFIIIIMQCFESLRSYLLRWR